MIMIFFLFKQITHLHSELAKVKKIKLIITKLGTNETKFKNCQLLEFKFVKVI